MTMDDMTREQILDLRCASLGDVKVAEAVRGVREFHAPGCQPAYMRAAFCTSRFAVGMSVDQWQQVFAWLENAGPCQACEVQGDHTGCEPAVCDCSCNDLVQLVQPLGNRSWAAEGYRRALSNHGNPGSHWALAIENGGSL